MVLPTCWVGLLGDSRLCPVHVISHEAPPMVSSPLRLPATQQPIGSGSHVEVAVIGVKILRHPKRVVPMKL